jgi:hypothetical protein
MITRNRFTQRALAVLLGSAVLAVGAGGCGSGRHGGPAAGAPSAGLGVSFSDCMRSHGVPDFPDALPGGGYNIPPTVDQQSPAYRSAETACDRLEPGPIAPHTPSERQTRLAVAFSRCVRAHGLPRFPDPSLHPPPPSQVQGIIRGGLYWVITTDTVHSPAFRQAAAACGWHISAGVRSAST